MYGAHPIYILARFSNRVASLMSTLTCPSTESGSMSLFDTLLPLKVLIEFNAQHWYRGYASMSSKQFLGFWTPSPLVCILARFIVLKSCNLPYYASAFG